MRLSRLQNTYGNGNSDDDSGDGAETAHKHTCIQRAMTQIFQYHLFDSFYVVTNTQTQRSMYIL